MTLNISSIAFTRESLLSETPPYSEQPREFGKAHLALFGQGYFNCYSMRFPMPFIDGAFELWVSGVSRILVPRGLGYGKGGHSQWSLIPRTAFRIPCARIICRVCILKILIGMARLVYSTLIATPCIPCEHLPHFQAEMVSFSPCQSELITFRHNQRKQSH